MLITLAPPITAVNFNVPFDSKEIELLPFEVHIFLPPMYEVGYIHNSIVKDKTANRLVAHGHSTYVVYPSNNNALVLEMIDTVATLVLLLLYVNGIVLPELGFVITNDASAIK